jgi:HD-GYP domain-containing protein (c-di-GMP phosphodiesterase class II)
MLRSAAIRFGYAGLPPRLLWYILFISALGPLVALAVAATGYSELSSREMLWAVMVIVLTATAERFPLHLTHKTNINVTAAAFIVALLLLPGWLPGLLTLIATSIAQLLRRSEAMEALFNIGQTVLYVTVAALLYGALADVRLGPNVGEFASVGVIIIAVLAMHLLNTGMVAAASAFQLGLNPVRVWATTIALDWMPHITLCALGTIGAVLAHDQPLVLPFLALPAVLVHQSVRQTVQLRVDTHEALASLVEVMELRDPYTAGHSRRVAALARMLAERLSLTAEEADLIEQAGRVHDIGKAGIDSVILSKPGKLEDHEWEQMKSHPVHGANVVARFAAYQHAARIVRHHHEALDGTGYPDGLTGEDIPLGARIIAVADTFDALTTNRPYRDALSIETAINILEQGAGRQWDARIVTIMCTYLRELNGELPTFRAAVPPGMVATVASDEATRAVSDGAPIPGHTVAVAVAESGDD